MPRPHRAPTLTVARSWPFEPHDIGAQLDATGRYALPFEREFPLSVRFFHYRAGCFTQGVTWHEQLEVFCPVEGGIGVRMGDRLVELGAGDVLVVDNLRLHHVVDRPGLDARVVVISFLPELVWSLGASAHDFGFLLPFYAQVESRPHVLRAAEPAAREAHTALSGLAAEFLAPAGAVLREAGCKARLLDLLLVLARRFHDAGVLRWEFERRRQVAERLSRVIEHVQKPGAPRLARAEAARMSGLSPAQFTRCFKKVAGMSYGSYVTHLRLAEAARLLRSGGRKIAEIALLTGFSDQSHFDRRFKAAFGCTPRQYQQSSARAD